MTLNNGSLQEYNKAAQSLVDELAKFFSIERNGWSQVSVSAKNEKGKVIPIINFHEVKRTSALVTRLKDFGFPSPSIEGTIALFNDVKKSRKPANVPDNPRYRVTEKDIDLVADEASRWMKEKGYEGRVVKGVDFIRVQNKKTATHVTTFLKTILQNEFKFEQTFEVIFFEPKKSPRSVGNDITGFSDHQSVPEDIVEKLLFIVTEIFKVVPVGNDEEGDSIIFGFATEKDTEDVQFFCQECGIDCSVKGTTIIFSRQTNLPPIERIEVLFQNNAKDEVKDSPSPVAPVVGGKDFYAEVRNYAKSSGLLLVNNQSMRRISETSYTMGFTDKDNFNAFIKKAAEEKPHWEIKRNNPDSNWLTFSVSGASEIISKPEFPVVIPEKEELTVKLNVGLSASDVTKVLKQLSDDVILKEVLRRGPEFTKQILNAAITGKRKQF